MRIEAKGSAGSRRGGAGWRAVTLVLLVAFTLQSFVTQTHLHFVHAAGATQVALQAPHPGSTPGDEGVGTCPFCQATIHAGAFFAPPVPVLALPHSRIAFDDFAAVIVARGLAPAHAWHSRAPPPSEI